MFHDFVRANKFAVIHFWAIWNGYDATMKEILERQIPPETVQPDQIRKRRYRPRGKSGTVPGT
jgi:hypothetical protein